MRYICCAYALFTAAALGISFLQPTAYTAGVSQNWLSPGIGGRYRVTAVRGAAAKAGIAVGDIIRWDVLPVADRWRARYGARRGTPITLAVERRSGTRLIRIRAEVPKVLSLDLYGVLSLVVGTVALILIAYVGYRRPGIAPLALATYAGGIIDPNYICTALSRLPDPLFIGGGSVLFALYNLFPNVALAAFAIRFPHTRSNQYDRYVTRVVDGAALLYYVVDLLQALNLYNAYYTQRYVQFYLASSTAFVVLATVYVYLSASLRERAKSRLILTAVAVSSIFYTITILTFIVNRNEAVLQIGTVLAIGLTAGSLAYAILKHHIFNISFVVNAALTVALTSGILLMVFTTLESFTEKALTHLTSTENVLLDAVIACIIVAAIAPVHRRADNFIDHALFRKRHETERSLRDLANGLRFKSEVPQVLDEAMAVFTRYLDVAGIAIYLEEGGVLRCVRKTSPSAVDVSLDDPAIRQLVVHGTPMNLEGYGTSLYGVRAYPMILGGRVIGALTIDYLHSHEAVAPDIDHAIDGVAQALGGSIKVIQSTLGT